MYECYFILLMGDINLFNDKQAHDRGIITQIKISFCDLKTQCRKICVGCQQMIMSEEKGYKVQKGIHVG